MCGIYGYAGRSRALVSTEALDAALRALAHRGPDDAGRFVDDEADPVCGFAHTRLSIIDLSAAGHQPFTTADGRFTITYNGELYNHRALRRELEQRGARFRSTSDTEVLLAAYVAWGPSAVERLRGMFAFGVWDRAERSLFLARDRFGIKPLYVCCPGGGGGANGGDRGLAFASEVRALLAAGAASRRISAEGLRSALAFGSVGSRQTIAHGVRSVLPGQALMFRDGRLEERRYWTIADIAQLGGARAGASPADAARSGAEAAEALRPVLAEAVKLHLIADVPVGVFLSGGVDSSVLAALASAASERPLRTFTVTFDEGQFSEAAEAAAIAGRFGCEHTSVHLPASDAAGDLARAVAALDQPSADGLNTYVVSKAARAAGLTVALSGLGGDELFAGYKSFRALARARAFAELVPSFAKPGLSALSALLALGEREPPSTLMERRAHKAATVFAGFAAGEAGEAVEKVYGAVRGVFTPAEIAELAPDADVSPTESTELPYASEARAALRAGDAVNALSILELGNYMHDTLLRDGDGMSMAHSLEVRVPLLDHVFAEKVLAVPGALKTRGEGNKALLMDLAPRVPREVATRKKRGFVLPLPVWLKGPLRPWLEGMLFDTAPRRFGGLLQRGPVERHFRAFLDGDDAGSCSRVVCLAALAGWAEANGASP